MAYKHCGACKFLGAADCGTECVLAPYFSTENQKMFEQLDKIFGADFIYKILSEPGLLRSQGEDTVRSLIYAAEARIRDPIFGIIGMYLEHGKELETIEEKIKSAKNELATIVGPDKVPAYYDLPIPDVGFSTTSSLTSIIGKIERLNAVQKN